MLSPSDAFLWRFAFLAKYKYHNESDGSSFLCATL